MKTSFFDTRHTSKTGYIMFDSISKKKKYVECERKEKLSNMDSIRIIQKIFKRDKKMMRSYLCPHCGAWHITHKL